MAGTLDIAFVEEGLAYAIAVAEVLDYLRLADGLAGFRSNLRDAMELGPQLLDVSLEFRVIVVSKQHHGMEVAPIVRFPLLGRRIAEPGGAHAFAKLLRELPLRIAEVFVALG